MSLGRSTAAPVGVVVFMKAATSKNRTDPIVRRQLRSCGVRV